MKRSLILFAVFLLLLSGCKNDTVDPTDTTPDVPTPSFVTDEDRENFLSAYGMTFTWEESAEDFISSGGDFYWDYPNNFIAIGQALMVFEDTPWSPAGTLGAVYLPDERTVSLEHISALFPDSSYGFNDYFAEEYIFVPWDGVDFYFYPTMVEYRKPGLELEPQGLSDEERLALRSETGLEERFAPDAEQMALKGEAETDRFGFGYLFPGVNASECTPYSLAADAETDFRLSRVGGKLELVLYYKHLTLTLTKESGEWDLSTTDRLQVALDLDYYLDRLVDETAKPDGSRVMVFLDQFFLGYWDGTHWNLGQELSARDLFFVNGYHTYTMTDYAGKTSQLAGFDLPVKFNHDLYADAAKNFLWINNYRFAAAGGYFTISGSHNPRPSALPVLLEANDDDATAVKTLLNSVGLSEAVVSVQGVYQVDLEQNGEAGRLILAWHTDTMLVGDGSKNGSYALMMYEENGIYETIHFDWERYPASDSHTDQDEPWYEEAHIFYSFDSFSDSLPFALFDANGDEILELYLVQSDKSAATKYLGYIRSGRTWDRVLEDIQYSGTI